MQPFAAPHMAAPRPAQEDIMDLLTGNLNRIFPRYLLTALGSAVISSIYTTVDMICVGHACGPNGTAAIALVNPLWSIMIAMGLLFGIGGSIWLATCRGAGDSRQADGYFTVSVSAAAIAAVALTLLYIFHMERLLRFFGANDALLPYAMDYVHYIAFAVPAFLLGTTLTGFIRNDGAPGLCMAATLTGGAVNIVGDIFFVFDFGLGMGMMGAGLATALGQAVTFAILCSHFLSRSCGLRLRAVPGMARRLGRLVTTGFAPAIVDLTFGITVILFNRRIMQLAGESELAVFSTIANVAILFQSLFYGVGQAIQPLASANFGAQNLSRVRTLRRMGLATAACMSAAFFALAQAFPGAILSLYMRATSDILAVGIPAMRVYAVSFLFMGGNVVSTYYLESVHRSIPSLSVSLLRGLVLPAVLITLLPAGLGFGGIWAVMPLTELLTLWAAALLLRRSVPRAG